VINPGADRAQRLATAEAADTQAAANTAAALRMELERQPRGPSRSPVRRRIPSPSPERRADAEAVVGHLRPSRRCTRTPARARRGRC
jgi:hypothetical protein